MAEVSVVRASGSEWDDDEDQPLPKNGPDNEGNNDQGNDNAGDKAENEGSEQPVLPPPPPTAKPIPLNPNIAAFNAQAGIGVPSPYPILSIHGAGEGAYLQRNATRESDWDDEFSPMAKSDGFVMSSAEHRLLSDEGEGEGEGEGEAEEDEEEEQEQGGGGGGDAGAGGGLAVPDPRAGGLAPPPIPEPPARSGSQRRKQLVAAHSFAILSPRAREAMAIQNLGRLANLVQRLVGHKEKDQFADVRETYKGKRPWVYQDMNAPLAHYFLSSGHNSYLTGNQLTSKSSVKPITDSLDAGCRVVEIDVWSGKREPKVLHGFTMTAPISFRKCARGIRKHAFRASAFPLIITLENHCNQRNKRWIVEIVQEEFGDLVHTRTRPWEQFPSPASLCGHILLRDKNDEGEGEGEGEDGGQLTRRSAKHWRYLQDDVDIELPELSRLITIVNHKHPNAVKSRVAVSSSRGESHFDELTKQWSDTVHHTQLHLLRTYPAAKRVDSSNYDAFVPWSFGAQIVAMNWQTPGPAMWAYRGMFTDNGGCGFVKKPDFLLARDPPNPNKRELLKMLCVRLLSARHMRHRTVCDNVVDVAVHGIAADSNTRRSTSKRAFDCCTWDEEFTFPLRCPELAVLCFTLSFERLAGKEGFGGQACIALNNLSEGRFEVPLLGKHGNKRRGLKRHMSVVVEIKTQKITGNLRRLLE